MLRSQTPSKLTTLKRRECALNRWPGQSADGERCLTGRIERFGLAVLARLRVFEVSIWMSASVAVVMAPAFARLRAEHLLNKLPGFSPSIDGENTLCSRSRGGGNGSALTKRL